MELDILYETLRHIYERRENSMRKEKLLYLYMIIKNRFRSELVQCNNDVGFDNFSLYQKRKGWFIPFSPASEKMLAEATTESVLDGPKIHCVEFRISPTSPSNPELDLCKENAKTINLYDEAIKKAIRDTHSRCTEKNFVYTYHFNRRKDDIADELTYRHQVLRKRISQQAESILDMRIRYKDEAKRIYGIDACSSELDCRPEVFGAVFRRLRFYDTPSSLGEFHQFQATYHVGEDNYDIVDGLRAIHEAILFLGLRSGNRLGHATMLGVSPKMFYSRKSKSVSMPKQYFLDNVVWMYYYIQNYVVYFRGVANILNYLKDKYELYFSEIYGKVFNGKSDIYTYYLSWLIRGDDPELYKNKKFDEPLGLNEQYKICSTIPEMKISRKNNEAQYLYYLYHYDKEVKEFGNKIVTEVISDKFIEAVALIQKEMQHQISIQGIGIETNPSSNVFISTISDYSEHPITTFFDKGISANPNFHQLNISINTDDKSVFSTSISNEYAYLAFYLENARNADGEPLYSRFDIFEWLDAIRRNGNEQSFIQNDF